MSYGKVIVDIEVKFRKTPLGIFWGIIYLLCCILGKSSDRLDRWFFVRCSRVFLYEKEISKKEVEALVND